MALPPGMKTSTVTFGTSLAYDGDDVEMAVTIKPTHSLVWAATGQPLVDFTMAKTAAAGVPGQFVLPVDQDGFVDQQGNAFRGFAYVADIVWLHGREQRVQRKPFQLTEGQTVVDLDLIPGGSLVTAVTAPVARVTSVNGQTGDVTVAGGGAGVESWAQIEALPDVPALATQDYVTQALVGVEAGGGFSGYDLASETAKPRLVRLNGGTPIITGSKNAANSHYSWSVIAAHELFEDPIDRYYAYDSPDHGGAGTSGSGIRFYTAPHPAGPWTHRRADGTVVSGALEYVYRDPVPTETETPMVFWWPQDDGRNLHMFYQEKSGPQITRLARSSDGHTDWQREPGFEISTGDHAGYMRIARFGDRLLGWSRATSGSGASPDLMTQWHCLGNPKDRASWVRDPQYLQTQEDATGPGWAINWAYLTPFLWRGSLWAITQLFPAGKRSNPDLGIGVDDRRLVLGPVSPDLRRFIGPVTEALIPTGSEVPDTGEYPPWRTVQAFTDHDGTVYVYYITSANVYVGRIQ